MNEERPVGHDPGVSTRTIEIVVAALLFVFGSIVIYDSNRLGSSWGSDGPQSGYFPFYIGLLICLSSVATLVQVVIAHQKTLAAGKKPKVFVTWSRFKQVLAVLLPSMVFVLGVQFIGIYVAAAVFIALFMVWLGHYSWLKSTTIGLAVPIATFLMFEMWFKVPLWKGTYNPLWWTGY